MIKHITAVGTGFGIVIDQPILDILGIDKNTPLEVKTDGRGLIIRPLSAAEAEAQSSGNERPRGPALPPPPVAAAPAVAPPPAPPMAAPPPPAPRPSTKPRTPEPPPLPAETASGGSEIVAYKDDQELCRVPFVDDEVLIGRDKACGVHLDDRALSRKHARLERRGASIWVQDLESANGTFVNGEEIKAPRLLRGGDVVGVGHYRVVVEGVAEAATDTPVLTLNGPDGVHRFALVGEQVVIGRAQTCDIAIGHKSISRRHLKIDLGAGKFVVEDLGSQNGVKLHGKRIKGPTPFKAGDALEICEFSISLGYLDDGAPSEKQATGAPKPRTMLIDKSALVNAAYFEGDFDAAKSGAANLALGKRGAADGKEKDTGEYELPPEEQKGKVVRGKRG
jgi:pSer/pThr/pTyr-binding forkhead associated (FHA) protein